LVLTFQAGLSACLFQTFQGSVPRHDPLFDAKITQIPPCPFWFQPGWASVAGRFFKQGFDTRRLYSKRGAFTRPFAFSVSVFKRGP
jgi:hypothetical protein